jgi:hypothetical protein
MVVRGVEELLERISNGKLADDRRNAMAELEVAVAENRAAKLAFGAMGNLPTILRILVVDLGQSYNMCDGLTESPCFCEQVFPFSWQYSERSVMI